MKKLSTEKLALEVKTKRAQQELTQDRLGELTGINRVMIGKIEKGSFIPSIMQLEALSSCLGFAIEKLFIEETQAPSFMALRSESLSDTEGDGFDTLISMMLTLRKQIMLRKNTLHA